MSIPVLWILAGVGLIVAEILLPTAFVLVCFGAGALAAGAVGFATPNPYLQWAAFFGVSILAILLTRGLARQWSAKPSQEFGAHGIIGKQARVKEEINMESAKGLIQVDGEEWKAISVDGKPIAEGAIVVVREVRGTRAVVEPANPK
jgi:membrane protein implicated in regulation of membrane protease activity